MTSPDTSAPADTRPPDPPDSATADPVVPLHRDRDFLLLWGGSAVSLLSSTATTIACPLPVVALTGSPFAAGPAGSVALLPALLLPLPATLLLPLPAGALVDRRPRGRLMIRCAAPRALGAAAIAVAATLGVLGLPLVLAVSFAEGVLTVFHGFAAHAAVPNVVPPGQLSPAVSRNEARRRAAVMPGTPLGGVLFGLGRAVPFPTDALAYPVSPTVPLFIREQFEAERSARTGSTCEQVREGRGWLWRHPFLRTTTLLVAGSNLMFRALFPLKFRALFLVAIVLSTDVGASSAGVGLTVRLAGAGDVLGSLAAPWLARRAGLGALVIGANRAGAVDGRDRPQPRPVRAHPRLRRRVVRRTAAERGARQLPTEHHPGPVARPGARGDEHAVRRGTADRLAARRVAARLGRCADRRAGAGGLDGAHRRRRPGRPFRTRRVRPAGSVDRRAPARPRLSSPPHPAGAHTLDPVLTGGTSVFRTILGPCPDPTGRGHHAGT
ncbi:MFS transporter [Streptomyces sp. NPDC006309]|uniref:MFS transporter n=1 Tax=Streptomyces sp. NPDC006309 TaxID=3156749 RepID=UPI0033AC0507